MKIVEHIILKIMQMERQKQCTSVLCAISSEVWAGHGAKLFKSSSISSIDMFDLKHFLERCMMK